MIRVLTDHQLEILKDLVEATVEINFDTFFGTPDEEDILPELAELIEINRIICVLGGFEETQTECYQRCKQVVLA